MGFSAGLRAELMKENIFVTTVCPGLMNTGGHENAFFRGEPKKEFALFSALATNPLLSMRPERAARSIVAACGRGQGELILPLSAKLAARAIPFFPGLASEALALINRWLPDEKSNVNEKRQGKDIGVRQTVPSAAI